MARFPSLIQIGVADAKLREGSAPGGMRARTGVHDQQPVRAVTLRCEPRNTSLAGASGAEACAGVQGLFKSCGDA